MEEAQQIDDTVTTTHDTIVYDKPIIPSILNTSIMWIEKTFEDERNRNPRYPYTRTSIPELDFVYDTNQLDFNETQTRCYNLATREYTTLNYDDCMEWSYCDTLSAGVEEVKQVLEQIDETSTNFPWVDPELIRDTRLRHDLNCDIETIWESYCYLEFQFQDLKTLYDSDIDPDVLEDFKSWYLNKIRDARESSFAELDQLEEEAKAGGATEEDLQDIDIIKQMFRDIPQDINLDSCETIEDVINIWPSLLSPRPEGLDYSLKQLVLDNSLEHELKQMLECFNIDDLDELKVLYNEVIQLQGDSNTADWAVTYLKNKIEELEK